MWRCIAAGVLATSCTQVLGIPESRRGACAPDAPFDQLLPVRGIDSPLGIQSAWLSADELTLGFSRPTLLGAGQRLGDLYRVRRDHLSEDFRDGVALDALNTELDEHGAAISVDEQTLYFDRRDLAHGAQIFAASLAAGEPGAPALVSLEASSAFDPFATASALFFASRYIDGSSRLFMAPGHGTSFATPVPLTALDAPPRPLSAANPVVSADQLTLYFSAAPDNASPPDIWRASREAPDQPFAPPVQVVELSSISAERPVWLSTDSCRMYFVTNRDGGGYALWMASRDP